MRLYNGESPIKRLMVSRTRFSLRSRFKRRLIWILEHGLVHTVGAWWCSMAGKVRKYASGYERSETASEFSLMEKANWDLLARITDVLVVVSTYSIGDYADANKDDGKRYNHFDEQFFFTLTQIVSGPQLESVILACAHGHEAWMKLCEKNESTHARRNGLHDRASHSGDRTQD